MDVLSDPSLTVGLIEVVIGIALLGRAADTFVEGAANVATAARVSPVLVGAIIVGFGTSAPELLVSGIAAVNGDLDLGVGNIVGSNVANITLVLGSAALMVPVLVSAKVLKREATLSVLAVVAFAAVTVGGLTRTEGVILLVALIGCLGWLVRVGLRDGGGDNTTDGGDGDNTTDGTEPSDSRVPQSVPAELVQTVLGLVGTIAGAQLLVWGATAVAAEVGLSGGFVGFTLVAVGTSLPELVTAVVAARRGATDLLLGNLLGSNLFNSLAVGGAIAVVGPGPIADRGLAEAGVGVMVVVAVGAWAVMVALRRISPATGGVLLVAWLVAVALLARTATDEPAEARRPVLVSAPFAWRPTVG